MKQVIFGMLFGVLFFSFWVSSCTETSRVDQELSSLTIEVEIGSQDQNR